MRASSVETASNPWTGRRILLAHSNTGALMLDWHRRRAAVARDLGYDLKLFAMCEHHPATIFPYLDRKWRRRDPGLLRFYDRLGEAIAASDVFIHFNGALIHPEFLASFRALKVYHCADDPDASAVLSQPVATHYDVCAIANPACLDLYRSWGCRHVFFWPLGAFHADDARPDETMARDVGVAFVGSKRGIARFRFLGRLLGLYRKQAFFSALERAVPELVAYGDGWSRGRLADAAVPDFYRRARLGINVHNSVGPLNGRLYDLAAFGVCQLCDNPANLHWVFAPGHEIVGFASVHECLERIRHFLAHPDEAAQIGAAARARYFRDYTAAALWRRFFADLTTATRAITQRPPSASDDAH